MSKYRNPKTKAVAEANALALIQYLTRTLAENNIWRVPMEPAVCACMSLSGLRRAEIAALKPDCLDCHTPKIAVKNAQQKYDSKNRVFGPTKSKKERVAPFDPILQQAIKKTWEENGQHEEERGISLRYIQERYLHSTEKDHQGYRGKNY